MQEEINARKELGKLKAQGIVPQDKLSIKDMSGRIAVQIEVLLPEDSQAKPLDFNIDVLGTRDTPITFSDFDIGVRANGQRTLSFYASMKLPEGRRLPNTPVVATSFTDFCWFSGNENLKPDHTPEVETKVTGGFNYGDIGWSLPCRFADRLLDALGTANDFILEGILQDAIIYGVWTN